MKLPAFLQSNALFQSESILTIRGNTSPSTLVSVSLMQNQVEICSSNSTSNELGDFSLSLKTPQASFDTYTLKVSGDEEVILNNILFGELWLATGQSNMEFPNCGIPEYKKMLDTIKGKNIRFFYIKRDSYSDNGIFPYEGEKYGKGSWINSDDSETFSQASALATKFSNDIYDALNKKNDVPVGFINASWGGTPITSWLKKSDIDEDPAYKARLVELGKYPDLDSWNTQKPGIANFQQTTCQYNIQIEQLEGLQIRGIIWYQGECEATAEFQDRVYEKHLKVYYENYCKRFAKDPNDFHMISTLIHYWEYGPDGECAIGYLNEAFISATKKEPNKFSYVPTSDLDPVWAQHKNNHPIHPVHKYPLGERMAKITLANVYGYSYKKTPATLRSVKRQGEKLILTFKDAKEGLEIRSKLGYIPCENDGFYPIHTLYVAGKDHIYLPAEGKITAKNTLEVRSDSIPEPKYVAYNMQGMEPDPDLFVGDYPVSSFYNDKKEIRIQQKPWYEMSNTNHWGDKVHGDCADIFYRPVWYPLENSEICLDTAFKYEKQASLHVGFDTDGGIPNEVEFGCYVRSYPYVRLEFSGFSKMQMNVFNSSEFEISLIQRTEKKDFVSKFTKIEDLGGGWCRFECNLPKVKDKITRMIFSFKSINRKTDYVFVNLEKIRLYK